MLIWAVKSWKSRLWFSDNMKLGHDDVIQFVLLDFAYQISWFFKFQHEITSTKGEISSPHYPDYYPAKKVKKNTDIRLIPKSVPPHALIVVYQAAIFFLGLYYWQKKIIEQNFPILVVVFNSKMYKRFE